MVLISTKTKEYFFGRHLCIRSVLPSDFVLLLNIIIVLIVISSMISLLLLLLLLLLFLIYFILYFLSKFLLMIATKSFYILFVVPLAEGEVAYSGKQDSQRWSDAQEKCKSNGKNLAKIRNIHDITEARKAFIQHHSPPYWVGVKFDTSINNFVWGDGTNAPNHVANFEAVVNRDEQLSQGYNMRCMLIESDENELQAAQCSDHYKYICQSGEHEDPGK